MIFTMYCAAIHSKNKIKFIFCEAKNKFNLFDALKFYFAKQNKKRKRTLLRKVRASGPPAGGRPAPEAILDGRQTFAPAQWSLRSSGAGGAAVRSLRSSGADGAAVTLTA